MEINMKRFFMVFVVIFGFSGMTLWAQDTDMSYYLNNFTRTDSTFAERLKILEDVRDQKLTGIGDFYHKALSHLLFRNADIKTREDHNDAEKSALILVQGLGAEKYSAAAQEIWEVADYFDIDKDYLGMRDINEGNTMREAYIALGQVGGAAYVPYMVQRLNQFNSTLISDAETRRRVQLVIVGLVSALDAIKDHAGFRPVFNVATGSYEPGIREIANTALIEMVDDPGDLVIEILEDPATDPITMQEAIKVMNASKAPDTSRAKVAAAALKASFNYHTTNRALVSFLNIIRKNAIDDLRKYGIPDDSVYSYLERSYVASFNNVNTDYDEIMKALSTLAASKSAEATDILYKFLKELNDRRRTGPWDRKERQVFEWVVNSIQLAGNPNQDVLFLLTTIQRSDRYTGQERRMAQNAITALNAFGR
jgi:hypothetical protein